MGMCFPRDVVFTYQNVCETTMFEAQKAIDQGADDGCLHVLVAGHQTAGRGQYNRDWLSGDGNIMMSIYFCVDMHCQVLLMVLATLIRRVLGHYADVWLKWPNDFYNEYGKIGGVLLETHRQWVIVGIGINTCTAPLSYVSSLCCGAKREVENAGIINQVVKSIYDVWKNPVGGEQIRLEWERHSLLQGKNVRVCTTDGQQFEGVFLGVDALGCARIHTREALCTVSHGRIHLVG